MERSIINVTCVLLSNNLDSLSLDVEYLNLDVTYSNLLEKISDQVIV